MPDKFLYEELDSVSNMGFLKKDIPDHLKNNLNPKFELRPYQEEAFSRFFHCMNNEFPNKESTPKGGGFEFTPKRGWECLLPPEGARWCPRIYFK